LNTVENQYIFLHFRRINPSFKVWFGILPGMFVRQTVGILRQCRVADLSRLLTQNAVGKVFVVNQHFFFFHFSYTGQGFEQLNVI